MLDTPVFWLHNTSYLYVATGAAAVTFFFERWLRETYNVLLYLDALATAMFTVLATERTLRLGFPIRWSWAFPDWLTYRPAR